MKLFISLKLKKLASVPQTNFWRIRQPVMPSEARTAKTGPPSQRNHLIMTRTATVGRKATEKGNLRKNERIRVQPTTTNVLTAVVSTTSKMYAGVRTNLNQRMRSHQGAIYQALCSATVSRISADHHIYQKEGNRWSKQPSSPQPFIKLSESR